MLKRVVADLDAIPSVTCPVVPYMDVVHDRSTIEILRGCTRGCRFCQAGMLYRPVRERGADTIVRDVMASLACTGYEEVSLTSLSSADHSLIDEVARRLAHRLEGKAVTISLPSSRVDAVRRSQFFRKSICNKIASGRAAPCHRRRQDDPYPGGSSGSGIRAVYRVSPFSGILLRGS